VIKALELPSKAVFLVKSGDKRLKLTSAIQLLEEAGSQNLDTALVVPQGNAQELIDQFRDSDELEEELPHKVPQPPKTGMDVLESNAKPISISIWDEGMWKIAAKNIRQDQTELKIRFYMGRFKGFRPFDFEGNQLSVEECFNGAQNDCPPTVYLAHLEQQSDLFPVEVEL
jgi:hypothetical protein